MEVLRVAPTRHSDLKIVLSAGYIPHFVINVEQVGDTDGRWMQRHRPTISVVGRVRASDGKATPLRCMEGGRRFWPLTCNNAKISWGEFRGLSAVAMLRVRVAKLH